MDNRYSVVTGKFEREIVLLKGTKCSYGKCKFCNYTLDNSEDVVKNFELNKTVLDQVTGFNQTLEVINSGNVFDIDEKTLDYVKQVVIAKQIKIVYFESYLNELKNLDKIRQMFDGVEVRFRIGLETTDDALRMAIGKPFSFEQYKDILSQNYYSACLLVAIEGQDLEMIKQDIEIGLKYFKQLTLNVFVDNNTAVKSDPKVKESFIKELYPHIKDDDRLEILIDNKDLGVFEQ